MANQPVTAVNTEQKREKWHLDVTATLETGEIPAAHSTVEEGVGWEDFSDPCGDQHLVNHFI